MLFIQVGIYYFLLLLFYRIQYTLFTYTYLPFYITQKSLINNISDVEHNITAAKVASNQNEDFIFYSKTKTKKKSHMLGLYCCTIFSLSMFNVLEEDFAEYSFLLLCICIVFTLSIMIFSCILKQQ